MQRCQGWMERAACRCLGVLLACTSLPLAAAEYYLAPSGQDSAAGSLAHPWRSIARAQASLAPGDRVWIRGGVYAVRAGVNTCASRTDTVNAITLDRSGLPGRRIEYWAYPGEVPVFDFSGMRDDCRVKGFNVVADWVHLKGLEITGVPQQPQNRLNHESWGVWIRGSHNLFEQLNLHHNMGPGLFIQNGGDNLVLNSDSHHNYDPYTSNGAGQSADGFGAHIAAGYPGNVFRGCRAWANSDDGFDLINAYSPVLIENSWAWLQGYLPGTTIPLPAGNGNGFKAGGYGGRYVPNAVVHTVRFSVAFLNKAAGFYANHHPLAVALVHNTAAQNHPDFNLLGIDAQGQPRNLAWARNNLAWGPEPVTHLAGTDSRHNSWDRPDRVTAGDFLSVELTGWDAPRQADGSLPALRSLHLAPQSLLRGQGEVIGAPESNRAPDLGAFTSP